jgi:hypothetical protein
MQESASAEDYSKDENFGFFNNITTSYVDGIQ